MGERIIKRLIIGVIFLILAVAFYAVYINAASNRRVQSVMSENYLPVYTAQADYQKIYPSIKDLNLTVKIPWMAEVVVSNSGTVKESLARTGQSVKKGQILAVLESPEIEADIASVDGQIEQARAQLISAQQTTLRYYNLLQVGGVSAQDYDSAVASRDVARGSLDSAIAQKRHLLAQKEKLILRAPEDGDILTSYCYPQYYAAAGQVMFVLGDFSKLYVQIDLKDSTIKMNKLAQKTWEIILEKKYILHKAYPGYIKGNKEKLLVKPIQFSPELNVPSEMRTVIWEIQNKNNFLEPTTYQNVMIISDSEENVLAVPLEAVWDLKHFPKLYVVDDMNKVHLRQVKTGFADEKYIQILSGVKKGEKVVISGNKGLTEGLKVTVMN